LRLENGHGDDVVLLDILLAGIMSVLVEKFMVCLGLLVQVFSGSSALLLRTLSVTLHIGASNNAGSPIPRLEHSTDYQLGSSFNVCMQFFVFSTLRNLVQTAIRMLFRVLTVKGYSVVQLTWWLEIPVFLVIEMN